LDCYGTAPGVAFHMPGFNFAEVPVKNVKTDTIW